MEEEPSIRTYLNKNKDHDYEYSDMGSTGLSPEGHSFSKLNQVIKGGIEQLDKLEKILGPDVSDKDCVAYVNDQGAYDYSGQKFSTQSALFIKHSHFSGTDMASRRSHSRELLHSR